MPTADSLTVIGIAAAAVLVAVAAAIAAMRRRRQRFAAPHAAPTGTALELPLASGRLAAQAWGADGGLVLCIPGLAATSGGFATVAGALADRRRVVAVDLRGRGHSEVTPPGTYGWPAHARDVLDAASALGTERFVAVGHSMGAYVAMQAAALAPGRVAALVLIDSAGSPDPLAAAAIVRAVRRLGRRGGSMEEHVQAFRDSGMVRPWSDVWERALREDLVMDADGVHRRTSGAAVMEDVAWAMTSRPRSLWPALDMPVLLVRAGRPMGRLGGHVVPARERDALAAQLPDARVVEVAANHLGVLTHPATAAAIADFVDGLGRGGRRPPRPPVPPGGMPT